MSDLVKRSELQKKLGFNDSDKWIFYDEKLQKFFDFFWDNIVDENILTEKELLEKEELIKKNEWLEGEELEKQKQQIEKEFPGIFGYTEEDVEDLRKEIEDLKKAKENYEIVLEGMNNNNNEMNARINRLEDEIRESLVTEKSLVSSCQTKIKDLEDLQKENWKLYNEGAKIFTQRQTPPLFMHQMPLDQYIQKCDTFTQYISLYLKDNFKIQETFDYEQVDNSKINEELESLHKQHLKHTLGYLKGKVTLEATTTLMNMMEENPDIDIYDIEGMIRETNELRSVCEHLQNTEDTLYQDLELHVEEQISQSIEFILYENTKEKQERILKRYEHEKHLSKAISDALSNAELVWIAIQLDLEKTKIRFDNSDQIVANAQDILQRTNYMKSLQQSEKSTFSMLLEKFAEDLSKHLKRNVPLELKSCLYEYKNLQRSIDQAIDNLLSNKSESNASKKLNELCRIEQLLRPLVYDGPLVKPMCENVRYLRQIFNAKMQNEKGENQLRELRKLFNENIKERMEKDKFWRFKQMLWIWFLTEPKRVTMAIQEVKKEAAKVPAITGLKVLGGIRRKQ